ncbi:HAD family hydrolase [Effusibacillus dendaii]|uniref:HAD family hydrolase n=1 Tax=Effusibacillus dendaii TaxID=2743772 RepID=UPI00190D6626|nr:HAD family hydrolase [Effusibacillus dendaii]
MSQHILFDLDDTLIHCNKHFTLTRELFLDLMMSLFQDFPVERSLIDKTQEKIDMAGVEKWGLGKNRFPDSLVQTYRLMCQKYGKIPEQKEEARILELGHSVYDFDIELYPYAMNTLEKLIKQGHDLYLYTGGDFQIQTQKVLEAGLDVIFPEQKRFIYEHKNTKVLRHILTRYNFHPQKTWMVGNSARSDIRPALETGIHAIHIPDEFGWKYDRVELDVPAKGEFHVLRSIADVPDVIAEIAGRGANQRREQMG